jgi:hypothetical protein
VGGIAILVGAALIGFGATQPWATGAATIAWGPLSGLTPNGKLGFDLLLAPDGLHGDVKPLILGATIFMAIVALLLIATRVRGLGMLWRILTLLTAAGLGLICATAWSVVSNPTSVLADSESPLGRILGGLNSVAESSGLLQIKPGLGLWLLTIGCGIACIGALIPAIRHSTFVPALQSTHPALASAHPPMSAGWYPDHLDVSQVRWFDGAQWTTFTRPRV